MMNNTVNVAIQVLPESTKKGKYELVDEAIKVIAASGFNYKVCPFETVVECTLDEALALVEEIHIACGLAGAEKMLTYLKIQVDFNSSVAIKDKMEKYE
ncbi:hypothetical protein MNBD_BACTEROID01-2582 [hydrothermal vent metagenome]|uniref:Thiamine-binding protein domain-containing protein n=1 Tax=hydrothermal vent metagenome TaxID=652676 RepID=A0A3B0UE25_9ZZZZ